jgi:hypothetical protein
MTEQAPERDAQTRTWIEIASAIGAKDANLSSRYSASSFFSSVSAADAATTATACARYAEALKSAPYGAGVHASAPSAALTTSSGIKLERTRPACGVMCA